MGLWLAIVTGQSSLGAPAVALHLWLMAYGLFGFFIFGFLLTALPNWINSSNGAVRRGHYMPAVILLALGCGLVYGDAILPGSLVYGFVLHSLGWLWVTAALTGILRRAPAGDKRQPWIAVAALWLGTLGDGLFALASHREADTVISTSLFTAASTVAIWLFLMPLFLAVCHRMLPWFTSRVVSNYVIVRPYGPLWAMLAACAGHAVLTLLDQPAWLWMVDLPLAGLAFWFMRQWGIRRSLSVRLLAILHIAFVWAGVAFLLYGLDSLAYFFSLPFSFGHAPIHALGIGFFAALLAGMASRVSLGHSGRPLVADALVWNVFWALQVSAILRLLPELFTHSELAGALYDPLIHTSALVWLLAFASWAWRFAPYYWQPRADGKAG